MSRATRLAELQDQVAKDAGYSGIAGMTGADRQRAEQAALLKLQHECCAAKLVSGGELVTSELIALNAAISEMLPAKTPQALEFIFTDGYSHELQRAINACAPDDVAKTALAMANDRILELEARNKSLGEQVEQLRRRVSEQPADEPTHQRPSQRQRGASPEPSANVVPMRSPVDPQSSAWAALAEANRHLSSSPYMPVDRFDASGRRLDERGLPASRRMDRDGA
jgi:hypothetical protein